jgi:primosomal protein N' (replication factor Y)
MAVVVTVAVPVPALQALSYRVPDGMAIPVVGGRVRVPLGRRVVTGWVLQAPDAQPRVAAASPPPTVELKDLLESLDPEPYLPQDVIDLALWVSEYYACGPGESLAAAMPPLVLAAAGRNDGFRKERFVCLTRAGRDALLVGASRRLGPKQRAAIQRLAGASDGLPTAQLKADGVSADTLARLGERGLVALDSRRVERDPFPPGERSDLRSPGGVVGGREPTTEQRDALQALGKLAREGVFRVALLHGVTGSGKTEVYLRLAREVVTAGRRVLVLVPEIALTPAVTQTFRAAFGDRVAIQHSALSPGARHDQWHRIRRGEVDVVVGTRSAVFAPLDGLGLLVVDEEHDTSYKQEESPRYHARSVAIVRAQSAGALVVLGSATPSLETFHHARRGRYRHVSMTERVHHRPLPAVQVVDMRAEMASQTAEAAIGPSLAGALEKTLARGEQALVLLNRRGFAAAVLCRQCGRTFECPNCSVALTLHRGAGRVRCHYCNYSVTRPSTCAHCAGPYLESVGFGTERIETELAALLPEATVARLDRDAARRRGAGQSLLARFRAREIDVLVGTQMIAKGHDFPNVTLVGVVSADVGLQVADFRAAEHTFQLLTQVAGRAGRGERPGTAIVQSFHPEHYSIVHACRQAYGPFFDEEMRYRTALHYPPVVSMVNAIVRGRSLAAAMRDAATMARMLRAAGASFEVLGPAVAPISRLRGQHRAQIFLKGVNRPAMRAALRATLDANPDIGRRVTIDVDPISLL